MGEVFRTKAFAANASAKQFRRHFAFDNWCPVERHSIHDDGALRKYGKTGAPCSSYRCDRG